MKRGMNRQRKSLMALVLAMGLGHQAMAQEVGGEEILSENVELPGMVSEVFAFQILGMGAGTDDLWRGIQLANSGHNIVPVGNIAALANAVQAWEMTIESENGWTLNGVSNNQDQSRYGVVLGDRGFDQSAVIGQAGWRYDGPDLASDASWTLVNEELHFRIDNPGYAIIFSEVLFAIAEGAQNWHPDEYDDVLTFTMATP